MRNEEDNLAGRQSDAGTLPPALTVEHALYLLALLLAGIMRLANLGRTPLSPAEAVEALAAWRLWQPAGVQANLMGTADFLNAPISPAYLSLTSPLTQLLGSGDSVMRLVPAFFGLGLVLLPWFLRQKMGRIGALTTSFLLAASPTAAAAARTAGGLSMALFAAFLLVIAWLHYQERGERRWLLAGAVALALGLASAPLFYGLLVALAIAWVTQQAIGPALFPDEEGYPQPTRRPAGPEWRELTLAVVIPFLALAAFFLLFPAGLGAAAALPVSWLTAFSFEGGIMAWMAPILALGRYELIAVILGGAAVVWASWQGDPAGSFKTTALPNFWVYWLTAGLIITLLQWGVVENMLLVSLPAYLLVGGLVDYVFSRPAGWEKWPLFGFFLLLGAIIVANLARFGRISLHAEETPPHIWLIIALLILGLLAAQLVATRSVNAAWQGVLAGLLICLLFYGWGVGWRLNHEAAADTRERWISAAADDELPLLAQTLRQVSRQYANSDYDLTIFSTIDSPALQWYLRDYPHLQIGHTLPQGVNSQAVITSVDMEPDAPYLGSRFGLQRPDTPHLLTLEQSVRWWLFHESPIPINREEAILWIKGDLVGR